MTVRLRKARVSTQYSYAFYWSLTTLTTVGYGDITPVSDVEVNTRALPSSSPLYSSRTALERSARCFLRWIGKGRWLRREDGCGQRVPVVAADTTVSIRLYPFSRGAHLTPHTPPHTFHPGICFAQRSLRARQIVLRALLHAARRLRRARDPQKPQPFLTPADSPSCARRRSAGCRAEKLSPV